MFAAELTKIKESEAKADELQKKAKVDARAALENAGAEAERITENAQNRAKEIYDSFIAEGEQISEEQYESYLASVRTACKAMEKKAKANETKAINLIAERIVRTSVDC